MKEPLDKSSRSSDGRRRLARRRHLRRLDAVFDASRSPLFYITVCTRHRRKTLANEVVYSILVQALRGAHTEHGWSVGRFVVMPDHVHFFCAPCADEAKTLSSFVGFWKRATAAAVHKSGMRAFAWQPEFFDHLMRSGESYAEKWEYVRANPVRAELAKSPDDWPFQGEICELTW